MTPNDMNIDVNHILHQLFQAHGVEAIRQGDWVVFPTVGMGANALITQEIKRPNALTVELEVRFAFGPGRVIVEGFAGVGMDAETAIADAFQNFAANTFHVLLAAFFPTPDGGAPGADGQVSQEIWVVGGEARRVTAGSLRVRGTPPAPGEQLVGLVQQFEQRLKQQSLQPGTHWVRLYYGQANGKVMGCEVLLDNQPWEPMQSQVAALGWPKGEGFYSVRVFMVIGDSDRIGSPPGSPVAPPAPQGEAPRAKASKWQFWRR